MIEKLAWGGVNILIGVTSASVSLQLLEAVMLNTNAPLGLLHDSLS